METNEITTNEEVVETAAEEIAKAGFSGGALAAGFGLGVLAGVVLVKYVARPIAAKLKAKKEAGNADNVVDADDYREVDAETESEEPVVEKEK